MTENARRLTLYNEGRHGFMIGHGDKPVKQGEHVASGLQFFKVDEVTELARGRLWTASLTATGARGL